MAKKNRKKIFGRGKKKRKHRGKGFGRKATNAFPGLAGNVSRRLGGGTRLVKKKKKMKTRGKKTNLENYKVKGQLGNNGAGILKYYGKKNPGQDKNILNADGIVRTDMPIDENKMKPALLRFAM